MCIICDGNDGGSKLLFCINSNAQRETCDENAKSKYSIQLKRQQQNHHFEFIRRNAHAQHTHFRAHHLRLSLVRFSLPMWREKKEETLPIIITKQLRYAACVIYMKIDIETSHWTVVVSKSSVYHSWMASVNFKREDTIYSERTHSFDLISILPMLSSHQPPRHHTYFYAFAGNLYNYLDSVSGWTRQLVWVEFD